MLNNAESRLQTIGIIRQPLYITSFIRKPNDKGATKVTMSPK